MEEEIDLRDYLQVVMKRWRVVAAGFLVVVAVTVVSSLLRPPIYEATVTLIEPSYVLMAESRIVSLDEGAEKAVKLYPTLARNPAVEEQVVQTLESILSPAEKQPGALLAMVRAVGEGANHPIFRISARASDPEKTKQIANTWAEEYVEFVAEVSPLFSGELGFFIAQFEEAEWDLAVTEEELTQFQGETGMGLASGDLDPYARLGDRGHEFKRKTLLLGDHRLARDNLLFLLQRAWEIKEGGGETRDLPLELLEVGAIADRGYLSAELVRQRGDDIGAVIALLKDEEKVISAVIDALAEDVARLQGELAADKLRLHSLEQRREVAREVYLTLSRKVQELKIRQKATRIVSPATVAQPVGPSTKISIVIAAALGLLVGIMAAFGLEYFEGSPQREKKQG